jgi:hypothetical protein
MTGCVDEADGHYILVEPVKRAKIADLEAAGFPPEGFAKHLGNKVAVFGRISNPESGSPPLVKVQRIETVAEGCAEPQELK